MSPLSSFLLLSLFPLALADCTSCKQNSPVTATTETQAVSMDPAEMGARLGRQLADKLRFMSYPTQQKSSFTPSDFPPSLFASLGLPVSSSSLPQSAPQYPFRPMPQQPNVFVGRQGGCPYCRGKGRK